MPYVLTKASYNMGIDACSERRSSYGSAIFYPAMVMLENEEDNKIKLALRNQYNIVFGP